VKKKDKIVFSYLVWGDTRRYGGVGRKSLHPFVGLQFKKQGRGAGSNFQEGPVKARHRTKSRTVWFFEICFFSFSFRG